MNKVSALPYSRYNVTTSTKCRRSVIILVFPLSHCPETKYGGDHQTILHHNIPALHIKQLQVADLARSVECGLRRMMGKPEVFAQRFFYASPSKPKFQTRSERRCQEVEEWLAEAWEDILMVTQEEVKQKPLEMWLSLARARMGSWPNVFRHTCQ